LRYKYTFEVLLLSHDVVFQRRVGSETTDSRHDQALMSGRTNVRMSQEM